MTNHFKLGLIICLSFFCKNEIIAECYYDQAIRASNFQIGIMLTWSTNAEVDHERFVIEKSENGIDFKEIGTVTGGGNTEIIQEYNFLHIYPSEHRIFYRLKEIAYSGAVSFSDIAVFENENPSLVRVVRLSEVFASNNFQVKLDSYTEGELEYILRSWQGNKLLTQSISLTNGLNNIDIDVQNLPLGIYKLALFLDNQPMDILTFKRIPAKGEGQVPVARSGKN